VAFPSGRLDRRTTWMFLFMSHSGWVANKRLRGFPWVAAWLGL
jgi:hypothetical protein